MKRYTAQNLPAGARMAVVTNDALGNFVMATPLMQMLRAKYAPAALDYFGGTRVEELAEASDLVDEAYSLHGSSPRAFAQSLPEPYDLVVNLERTAWSKCSAAMLAGKAGYVCGPCLDAEGRFDLAFADDERGKLWADPEWLAEDITRRYPFLRSGFIGEMFCRLAYLDGPVPGYRLPQATPDSAIPDVLISLIASQPEKLWSVEHWVRLVQDIREREVTVGLVGAKPKQQSKYWTGADSEGAVVVAGAEDLRGRLTLPQVVGAIGRARLVVAIDNGIVHLACATDTPVLGLFRHGIHRLWAPPVPNLRVIEPGVGGQVAHISYTSVWDALQDLLN